MNLLSTHHRRFLLAIAFGLTLLASLPACTSPGGDAAAATSNPQGNEQTGHRQQQANSTPTQ